MSKRGAVRRRSARNQKIRTLGSVMGRVWPAASSFGTADPAAGRQIGPLGPLGRLAWIGTGVDSFLIRPGASYHDRPRRRQMRSRKTCTAWPGSERVWPVPRRVEPRAAPFWGRSPPVGIPAARQAIAGFLRLDARKTRRTAGLHGGGHPGPRIEGTRSVPQLPVGASIRRSPNPIEPRCRLWSGIDGRGVHAGISRGSPGVACVAGSAHQAALRAARCVYGHDRSAPRQKSAACARRGDARHPGRTAARLESPHRANTRATAPVHDSLNSRDRAGMLDNVAEKVGPRKESRPRRASGLSCGRALARRLGGSVAGLRALG
jgi:hypothetical protein